MILPKIKSLCSKISGNNCTLYSLLRVTLCIKLLRSAAKTWSYRNSAQRHEAPCESININGPPYLVDAGIHVLYLYFLIFPNSNDLSTQPVAHIQGYIPNHQPHQKRKTPIYLLSNARFLWPFLKFPNH